MLIKERPIITWLLHPERKDWPTGLLITEVSQRVNHAILRNALEELNTVRIKQPEWGLPELIMPSFEEVMRKSSPSFEKILPELFHEFCKNGECGVVIRQKNTLIYGFSSDTLYIWYFTEDKGESIFNFHFSYDFVFKQPRIGIDNTLIQDNAIFHGNIEDRHSLLASIVSYLLAYIAVKRFVKVETVIVPKGKFTALEGTPLEYVEKKKVINMTGQEVIVMDSI